MQNVLTIHDRYVHNFQKIQYFTDANSSMKKTDKIVLKQESMQGCEAGQQQQFNVNILVPTVPPSRHQICNIIKIKYFIRVSEDWKLNLNPISKHFNF